MEWVTAAPEVFSYDAGEYGPFGELVRATGPLARLKPIRFSSKFHDEETEFLKCGYWLKK